MAERRSSAGRFGAVVLAWVLPAIVSGCTQAHDLDPVTESVEGHEESLIGGFAANNSALDAVGSLSLRFDDPYYGEEYYDLACSGSLIGPTTVLTAKHCVDAVVLAYYYGGVPVFTVGPSSFTPKRAVEVIDFDSAPSDAGGFVGYGNDVGVLYLGEPIDDIEPVTIGTLSSADIGSRYAAIGYGEQDILGSYGTRRIGALELRALSGLTWEHIFGSFEAFYEWQTGQPLPPECPLDDFGDDDAGIPGFPIPGEGEGDGVVVFPGDPFVDCYFVAFLWYEYNAQRLEDAGDVYVGGQPGNAQPCYGDSGGPLARMQNGNLVAYAVTSGGVSSRRLQCDRGGVYASFPPETLDFLSDALQWVDPCGGLPVSGVCEGDLARRCTSPIEGPRRSVEFDCSLVGLPCTTQSDGTVGCGDDDSFADVPEPPYEGMDFPELRELEGSFFRPPTYLP